MRRARSTIASLVCSLFGIAVAGYVPAALATDDLNCQSPNWALTIAVGTNGYVNNLLVHSKAPRQVQEPVLISNFVETARHVDVKARAIDVKANAPNGDALNIRLMGGNGHIHYLGRSEQLACDWTT